MSTTLKLAFVGCGAISHYHLAGIKEKATRIQVTAAIDPNQANAQKIADDTGARIFSSLEQGLAEGDFDAVDLMLPHDLHESAAITALRAGKHVLLEKPMAPTLDACERILAVAKDSPNVFMVGENSQYWPEVVKAQELIVSGAIGDLITARAALITEIDEYWFQDEKPWRYDTRRTGGGITIDGGAHWIRPLRIWMGEIDEVVAVLDYPCQKMEGESLTRALFRFKSGKFASFDAMMIDSVLGPDAWFHVTGTKGEIVIEGGFEGGLKLYDADHRDGKLVQKMQGYFSSFGPELENFASAVLDGEPLVAGPEQSLGELRTALAIYRSAASKQWEKVWD